MHGYRYTNNSAKRKKKENKSRTLLKESKKMQFLVFAKKQVVISKSSFSKIQEIYFSKILIGKKVVFRKPKIKNHFRNYKQSTSQFIFHKLSHSWQQLAQENKIKIWISRLSVFPQFFLCQKFFFLKKVSTKVLKLFLIKFVWCTETMNRRIAEVLEHIVNYFGDNYSHCSP